MNHVAETNVNMKLFQKESCVNKTKCENKGITCVNKMNHIKGHRWNSMNNVEIKHENKLMTWNIWYENKNHVKEIKMCK